MEWATSMIKSFFISNTVYPIFKNFNPERNSLLDPLSVIIVLAMNSFKPISTKLSIQDHRLFLHDTSIIQGTVRTLNGDSKANVKALHFPILYACKFHLSQYQDNSNVANLFIRAKKGLENLRHTYKADGEIRACLNTYINVIQSCLDNQGEKTFELLDRLLSLNMSDEEVTSSGNYVLEIKNQIFDEMNKVWDQNKIALTVSLISEMETAPPTSIPSLFKALENVMDTIHERTNRIVEAVLVKS
jgi:hypothetical protein